jgi:hypothetical protein
MNDLDLLNELGTELDPPNGPSAALRHRALSMVDTAGPARPRRGTRSRWLIAVAATAVLATAAGVALATTRDNDRLPGADTALPSARASAPVKRPPPESAELLLLSAAAAAREAPVPRPDQYLHIHSITSRSGTVPSEREVWKSVDGTRVTYSSNAPTAYFPGCKNGVLVGKDDRPTDWTGGCTPQPGYRQDLPSTLDGMRDLLRTRGLKELVMDIYQPPTPNLLPPQTEAALFEALAESPGVSLVPDVVDAAGRPGVAAVWMAGDVMLRLIFDPDRRTFRSFQLFLAEGKGRPDNGGPNMEDTLVSWDIADAIPDPPPAAPVPSGPARPGRGASPTHPVPSRA